MGSRVEEAWCAQLPAQSWAHRKRSGTGGCCSCWRHSTVSPTTRSPGCEDRPLLPPCPGPAFPTEVHLPNSAPRQTRFSVTSSVSPEPLRQRSLCPYPCLSQHPRASLSEFALAPPACQHLWGLCSCHLPSGPTENSGVPPHWTADGRREGASRRALAPWLRTKVKLDTACSGDLSTPQSLHKHVTASDHV